MTVTDAMVEAGCTKYLDLMVEATGNEDEVVAPEFMRAAIEAALAVMPIPTNAEIERALNAHEVLVIKTRHITPKDVLAHINELDESRTNLLRLIAAQREAARREALEAVQTALRSRIDNYPQFDETGRLNALAPGNEIACKMMIRHIDAMLAKEAE